MCCRSSCWRVLCVSRLIMVQESDLRDDSGADTAWKRQQTCESGHAILAPGYDVPPPPLALLPCARRGRRGRFQRRARSGHAHWSVLNPFGPRSRRHRRVFPSLAFVFGPKPRRRIDSLSLDLVASQEDGPPERNVNLDLWTVCLL